jgi:hypothetical protein
MWIHSLLLLRHLFAEAQATEQGTTVKEVTCEGCGSEYVYQLRRAVHGRVTTFLVRDDKAATTHALAGLDRLLQTDFDPVPCPQCGWYQRAMVSRLKQLRTRGLWTPTIVLLPLAAALGAFGGLITLLAKLPGGPPSEVGIVLLALSGAGAVLGVGLPLWRLLSSWWYDPNLEDVDARIRRGQARAVNKAAYLSGTAVPPPG